MQCTPIFVFLVAVHLTCGVLGRKPTFRNDYLYDEDTNAFYKEHTEELMWGEAQAACVAEGAGLAAPRNPQEAATVLSILDSTTIRIWLGIHDKFTEGTFTAVDGTSDLHINWAAVEPNNFGDGEDCVSTYPSGECNDIPCDWTQRFVCMQRPTQEKMPSRFSNPSDQPFFRADYKYARKAKAFFKAHPIALTWAEALSTCTAEGATLFYPRTDVDLAAGLEEVEGMEAFWVGSHALFEARKFVTIEGHPISEAHIVWREGEPDNMSGNEDCVELGKDGKHNDISCTATRPYLCRKDLSKLYSENVDCENRDFGYEYSPEQDVCYKLHTSPRPWNEAYKICKSEDATLAVVNSAKEAEVLINVLAKKPEEEVNGNFDKTRFHLGFNDVFNGVFRTITGQTLKAAGYEEWAPLPASGAPSHRCGGLQRTGLLTAGPCNASAMYLCEKTLSDPLKISLTG